MTIYRFVLNSFARPVPPPSEPSPTAAAGQVADMTADAEPGPLPAELSAVPETAAASAPEPFADLTETEALVDALCALTAAAAVTFDDLVQCGLLPEGARGERLDIVRNALAAAQSNSADRGANRRAHDGGLSLRKIFDERGQQAAQALVLLAKARKDAGIGDTDHQAFERIARYFGDPRDAAALTPEEMEWAAMSGDPGSIAGFTSRYVPWKAGLKRDPKVSEASPDALWRAWRWRVQSYLLNRKDESPISSVYPDVVAAAAGKLPGRLFRLPLSRMDRIDWSDAALQALPREDGRSEVPRWLLFAALAALGFSTSLLRNLQEAEAELNGSMDPEDLDFVTLVLGLGKDSRPAVLEIYADRTGPREPAEIDRAQPVFSIGKSVAQDYFHGLKWLRHLNAFMGATHEHEE